MACASPSRGGRRGRPPRAPWRAEALALILAPALTGAALAADAPPPDTSGYTLFDPVPDDRLRPLNPDRPTKAAAPFTVDAGHFQVEADLVAWTWDHDNAARVTVSDIVVADPALKLGLTHDSDLELALVPLDINRTQNQHTGLRTSSIGFGDLDLRLKVNLFGDDGGDLALAVVPYVKAPTAGHALGNGYWEGGFYAPFQVTLPEGWTMVVMTQLEILENAALNGQHTRFDNLVNFNHALFSDTLTGYVEFWSATENDVATPPQYTLDFSLAWQPGGDLQLDIGVNIGLDKAASDVQAYLGVSRRF